MRFVIIESPYSGNLEYNRKYLDACILDCMARGETPYSSHLMLTSALNDDDPEQRRRGMEAGFAVRRYASATVVYHDLGISGGMRAGIDDAIKMDEDLEGLDEHEIEYRYLGEPWSKPIALP